MPDLGPHATFIIAAYAVTFVSIGALTLAIFEDDRKQRRVLAELERRGIRRRSAKPSRKTTAKAPPAKRKPRATHSRGKA
ncbi:MAG: heme exporter protein CcmD [Hyphomicrobiales bacterium]